MAHETLKTLITQNIKTNGQNAITAQILQDVLIAMVDECPDITGYATRSWVTTKLSDYLPLTGGTLTGDLNFANEYGSGSIFVDSIDYDLNITASNSIYLDAVRGVSVNGKITANTFEKSGGTSAQFLKADGSIDENTYVTGSALSDYLPLTGGTLTGYLFFSSNEINRGEIFGDEYGLNIQVSGQGKLFIENAIEANSTIKTEGFIKSGGTSDEVLCADGSVKTLSALKAALDAL